MYEMSQLIYLSTESFHLLIIFRASEERHPISVTEKCLSKIGMVTNATKRKAHGFFSSTFWQN